VFGFSDRPANANVASAVDVKWFWETVVESLARASKVEKWSAIVERGSR
jgi:hypothetical protein